MSQDDLESELFYHQMIDDLVESFAEAYEKRGRRYIEEGKLDEDTEVTIKPEEKADAKQVLHTLVPYKSPRVAIVIIAVLKAVTRGAAITQFINQLLDDPEKFHELIAELRESDSAESIINRVQEKQDALQSRYRDVNLEDKTMKVADLGDVATGMSLN